MKGEPDASSFPSGRLRSTFEARGYTAWDPTSPPWLLKSGGAVTLVIPTAFVSWPGEALDKKTPPAIISIFLGDMLTDIFEQIEKGGAKSTKAAGSLDTGVSVLPKLPRDAGDRNRTSPFAFTGNKFEFRAVAYPNIALNVAVCESLDYIATELEKATAAGKSVQQAAIELLPKLIKENKRIIFNGNNYSKEWGKEAAKRGLLNTKNTVDALPQLVSKEAIALFEKCKVLNKHFRDAVIPAMVAVRETSDALECVIPHGLWPLATIAKCCSSSSTNHGRSGGSGSELEPPARPACPASSLPSVQLTHLDEAQQPNRPQSVR